MPIYSRTRMRVAEVPQLAWWLAVADAIVGALDRFQRCVHGGAGPIVQGGWIGRFGDRSIMTRRIQNLWESLCLIRGHCPRR
jgi:hypothetical protein